MKKISIVTPCYNEVENISELVSRIRKAMNAQPAYEYEIIIIDNFSTDGTRELLREMATNDFKIKVILNTRNFGHIRSPYFGLLSASGDAAIYMASDFQDPPEMIPEFIKEWERGFKLVLAVKPESKSQPVMHFIRKIYYRLVDRISNVSIIKDSTGFGLYDKKILEHLRKINDPYPFLRGLICEIGYEAKKIPFIQPRRWGGITKNNIYTLFDIAMLGMVSHSKIPIRVASILGILMGVGSVFIAIIFFILKLIFWESFPMGSAPLIIGVFFLLGLQIFFIGILGEYIGTILTYIQNRPIVIEKERINF